MVDAPTCSRCGSDRIRRARTRTALQRVLRRVTPLRRYACAACGHRGWRLGGLPRSEHPEEQEGRARNARLPARPLERRDLRAKRARRLKMAATLVFAAALGALAAARLASCQAETAQSGDVAR